MPGSLTKYIILLSSLVSPTAAGEECIVHGERVTLADVTVRARTPSELKLVIREVPATARIPNRSDVFELNVESPISFNARRKNVVFTINSDYVTPDGMVTLRRGARLAYVKAGRIGISASAVLWFGTRSYLNTEPDEFAGPFRVPCSMLTLGELTPDENMSVERNSNDREIPFARWRSKKRGPLTIRSRPTDTASFLRLTDRSCDDDCRIEVDGIDQQGEWVLVQKTEPFGSDVVIRGWVSTSQVTKIRPRGRGYGAYLCCEDGPIYFEQPVPDGGYEGPAEVLAGARVFALPGVGEWGTVKADTYIEAHNDGESEWFAIRRIRGLSSFRYAPLFNAYVAADQVVLPATEADCRSIPVDEKCAANPRELCEHYRKALTPGTTARALACLSHLPDGKRCDSCLHSECTLSAFAPPPGEHESTCEYVERSCPGAKDLCNRYLDGLSHRGKDEFTTCLLNNCPKDVRSCLWAEKANSCELKGTSDP